MLFVLIFLTLELLFHFVGIILGVNRIGSSRTLMARDVVIGLFIFMAKSVCVYILWSHS